MSSSKSDRFLLDLLLEMMPPAVSSKAGPTAKGIPQLDYSPDCGQMLDLLRRNNQPE